MATGQKVFEVLTEFRFEAQDALSKTGLLQVGVGKIAAAAEGALSSFKSLGSYLASGLGVGAGVAGILMAAVKSSETLTKNSLAFSNIMGGNLEHLQGDVGSFNDRMVLSKQIMMDISKAANKFSLPEQSLLATTKNLAAMLIPKGLAGNNMSAAIDLSRSFEKSAPTLGVDTQESQGMLVRMIEGQAQISDTLFRRLLMETKSFEGIRSSNNPSKSFNAQPLVARFAMLQKGMAQFSSDADVNMGIASLLSNKFQVLKDKLLGINGVLIPLGQAIIPALRKSLDLLISWIDTKGRSIILRFSEALKTLADNPDAVIATLYQLKGTMHDMAMAGKASQVAGIATLAGFLFGLAKKIPAVNAGLAVFSAKIGSILGGFLSASGFTAGMAMLPKVMAVAGFAVRLLGFALTRVVVPLMILFGIFQLLSRAKGYAKINDVKALAMGSDRLAEVFSKITKAVNQILMPFYAIFDGIARFIAPMFEVTTYLSPLLSLLEFFATALQVVADSLTIVYALLNGFFGGLVEGFKVLVNIIPILLKELLAGIISQSMGGTMDFTKTQAAFSDGLLGIDRAMTAGMEDVFNRSVAGVEGPEAEKHVANNVTHIGAVNVRQDFKENMEPDRIASSLIKTLSAIAKNPTQSNGRSMQGALLGAN